MGGSISAITQSLLGSAGDVLPQRTDLLDCMEPMICSSNSLDIIWPGDAFSEDEATLIIVTQEGQYFQKAVEDSGRNGPTNGE